MSYAEDKGLQILITIRNIYDTQKDNKKQDSLRGKLRDVYGHAESLKILYKKLHSSHKNDKCRKLSRLNNSKINTKRKL